MNNPIKEGIWDWSIVKIVVSFTVLLTSCHFYFYGFSELSIRYAIRWTARISGFLFTLAFGASAIHLVIQNSMSFWLYRNRKFFGISFAIIHFLHLIVLIILQISFHPVFEMAAKVSLFAGGMAYIFIVLMFLTSFSTFSKQISRSQWKWLHVIGGYWILFIFMRSNWRNALFKDANYYPMALFMAFILLLRIWKFWKDQQKIKNNSVI